MPDDLKILQDMLQGYEEKGKELRAKEALFIKSQGLDEAIQRNMKEKAGLEKDLKDGKEALKELKEEKKSALSHVSETICQKLNQFLPTGEAFFDAFNALSFGWVYNDTHQTYNSLSGGQKQIFDTALENLLGSNIMIVEAGEIDKSHLSALLEDFASVKKQIFVNSWHCDVVVPEEFKLVMVGE